MFQPTAERQPFLCPNHFSALLWLRLCPRPAHALVLPCSCFAPLWLPLAPLWLWLYTTMAVALPHSRSGLLMHWLCPALVLARPHFGFGSTMLWFWRRLALALALACSCSAFALLWLWHLTLSAAVGSPHFSAAVSSPHFSAAVGSPHFLTWIPSAPPLAQHGLPALRAGLGYLVLRRVLQTHRRTPNANRQLSVVSCVRREHKGFRLLRLCPNHFSALLWLRLCPRPAHALVLPCSCFAPLWLPLAPLWLWLYTTMAVALPHSRSGLLMHWLCPALVLARPHFGFGSTMLWFWRRLALALALACSCSAFALLWLWHLTLSAAVGSPHFSAAVSSPHFSAAVGSPHFLTWIPSAPPLAQHGLPALRAGLGYLVLRRVLQTHRRTPNANRQLSVVSCVRREHKGFRLLWAARTFRLPWAARTFGCRGQPALSAAVGSPHFSAAVGSPHFRLLWAARTFRLL